MLTCFQVVPVILQKIIDVCEEPTRQVSKSNHPKNSVISQKRTCALWFFSKTAAHKICEIILRKVAARYHFLKPPTVTE